MPEPESFAETEKRNGFCRSKGLGGCWNLYTSSLLYCNNEWPGMNQSL